MKQVFYAKIPSSPSPLLTIKYESKTYFELPAARSTPHGELRISMFFGRHLPLYCITKQEPSHGSNFWITGTPAPGNREHMCLTGLK